MRGESRIPEGVWQKCRGCGELIFIKELIRNLRVCPRCGFHFPMGAEEYVDLLTEGRSLSTIEDVHRPPYLIAALTQVKRFKVVIAALDPSAEKLPEHLVYRLIALAFESAAENGLPLITITPGGLFMRGEGRDKETIKSIVLMEESALKFEKTRLMHISILTCPHPTYDFATLIPLGDLVFAEPRGRTDIEVKVDPAQLYNIPSKDKLIDRFVKRKDMRRTIRLTLRWSS
ncbi:hypothetical protein J7M22_02405 [Candidatus Poribacteria bacterium]|nr:hypothetical protein [Candidatus Poribacteria bacterium]